ncbi:transglutaminase domain-containing protein [Litoribacter alkaliphilus]|uniref:Transglutaminase domain-containing protein n=1 Tax=Litoribacter ruber TaxID=702568 RepID=A0AAP2CKG6_9BACT|nr:transglutaminase-like domain-containing protein [Litoribacter alkaliphilus]MBS9525797.1 transglutaminase domain-containing protein [Litoribacter alkaliphilus]
MAFNEDSRVKIPAGLDLVRLGYIYILLKGLKFKSLQSFAIFIGLTLLTFVQGCKSDVSELKFGSLSTNQDLHFWYEGDQDNEYLDLLRSKYPIDSLVRTSTTDTERAQRVMNWVHNQWRHDGNNEPRQGDAVSILEEVKEGKNFRCVEYAVVASACLNAVGLKTRTLGLKTKEVETKKSGAGHVVSEVFLNDLDKWVFIDPQWDVMPVLNNRPLNAVEFQQAITNDFDRLEIHSSNASKSKYVNWIAPYLFYFDIPFDNREGVNSQRETVHGKSKLMLVPHGAKEPTVFQRRYKINNVIYTNSIHDFYASPYQN